MEKKYLSTDFSWDCRLSQHGQTAGPKEHFNGAQLKNQEGGQTSKASSSSANHTPALDVKDIIKMGFYGIIESHWYS